MEKYNHQKIEKKWQNYWEEKKIFEVKEDKNMPKEKRRYVLDMFPYPSAQGLHVGHPEGYTATDIICRYLRMNGYHVLHPMGWDSFGLPTENYAIKINVHPKESSKQSIKRFREQIKSLGFSYDWSREVNTSSPEYYRWTQWLFLQLYKNGLAYKKKAPVNWCEHCQTVLANEQATGGECERCHQPVIQKDLEQWFFKITDYADRLLKDVDKIDWPEKIKIMQEHWIGRSEGATVQFGVIPAKAGIQNKKSGSPIKSGMTTLEVFTTRPDTLFGATYMVIAPEHPLIENFKFQILNFKEIQKYQEQTRHKTDLERSALEKEKTGVELKGIKAINPVNGEELPIFIADYVLMGYGTGAIMAVPAHDERDWEFAKKYELPIKQVVREVISYKLQVTSFEKAFVDDGMAVNSNFLNGLNTAQAKEKMIQWLEEKELGKGEVQYKLRDWLVSRQRYWGAPIPIIYCEKCDEVPVPEKDLPVLLPDDVDFRPTGESPLTRSKKFHEVKCPQCGKPARRESDTMDTFVCSSWYYLRYCDPDNNQEPFSQDKIRYWCPVDLYVGGAEHAVMHLLYARFIAKFLSDQKMIDFDEPFLKLKNQGLILGEGNQKMSKSRGNVVNPDDILKEYGADILRLYEMFMGPFEDAKPWSTKSIIGVRRFLEKVWGIQDHVILTPHLMRGKDPFHIHNSKRDSSTSSSLRSDSAQNDHLERLLHKTIRKVTEDIENFKFNTAISALMILTNEMSQIDKISNISAQGGSRLVSGQYSIFLKLLFPFAPHIAEELWSRLGNKESIIKEKWPEYNPELAKDETITLAIQINGKLRDTLEVQADLGEDEAKQKALSSEKIQKWLAGHEPKKVIYVKGRLVSIVV